MHGETVKHKHPVWT